MNTNSYHFALVSALFGALVTWLLSGMPSPFVRVPELSWGFISEDSSGHVANVGRGTLLILNDGKASAKEVQIFWEHEISYLADQSLIERTEMIENYFVLTIPTISRGNEISINVEGISRIKPIIVRLDGEIVPEAQVKPASIRPTYASLWPFFGMMLFFAAMATFIASIGARRSADFDKKLQDILEDNGEVRAQTKDALSEQNSAQRKLLSMIQDELNNKRKN